MQCILVKSDEFENSYPLLCVGARSPPRTAPLEKGMEFIFYFCLVRHWHQKRAQAKYAMISFNSKWKYRKISRQATFSKRRGTWSFHVVILQRTAEKCTKIYNARAQLLLGDVSAAFVVVVCLCSFFFFLKPDYVPACSAAIITIFFSFFPFQYELLPPPRLVLGLAARQAIATV